jgi:hypothetical protein
MESIASEERGLCGSLSSNPDRYFLASGQNVLTIELHDLKVLSLL